MQTEIARLARYVLPSLLTYAVGRGWIPEGMQQPLYEALIAGIGVGVAWWASRKRDQARF